MGKPAGQRAPALVVRDAATAAATLRLASGRPVLLLSAEGAAAWLGAAGWRALIARAAAECPAVPMQDALCCAASPGLALVALRAGCRTLVLDGNHRAFPAVDAAAREVGATLLPARPAAFDLATVDLRRPAGLARLAAWLAAHPHDSGLAKG